jgi:hypothetical protein
METEMARTWWWVIGGLAAVQAPYWAVIIERVVAAI